MCYVLINVCIDCRTTISTKFKDCHMFADGHMCLNATSSDSMGLLASAIKIGREGTSIDMKQIMTVRTFENRDLRCSCHKIAI